MGTRLELHAELCGIMNGSNVYFQPPDGLRLQYPCIVYSLDRVETDHADNMPHHHRKKYQVTLIDRDPESEALMKLADLPTSSHNRRFVSDNLYHDVFTIYY